MHNWSGSDLSTRFFSFACNPIEQKRVLTNMIFCIFKLSILSYLWL